MKNVHIAVVDPGSLLILAGGSGGKCAYVGDSLVVKILEHEAAEERRRILRREMLQKYYSDLELVIAPISKNRWVKKLRRCTFRKSKGYSSKLHVEALHKQMSLKYSDKGDDYIFAMMEMELSARKSRAQEQGRKQQNKWVKWGIALTFAAALLAASVDLYKHHNPVSSGVSSLSQLYESVKRRAEQATDWVVDKGRRMTEWLFGSGNALTQ